VNDPTVAYSRAERLRKIRAHIEQHGVSITLVSGGSSTPRFAYTIGLHDGPGFDLVVGGAAYFSSHEVHHIVDRCATAVREDAAVRALEIPPLGTFSLEHVDDSWVRFLALGALDYYSSDTSPFRQIIPEARHVTIDVPDMAHRWDPGREPVWRWLGEPWDYPVPEESVATTNLSALRGDAVTELMRWEETEWEMFAGPGPEVTDEQARVVPLGTMLGGDATLEVAITRPVGEGCYRRDRTTEWHVWKSRSSRPE
jgi:hypothetical protein